MERQGGIPENGPSRKDETQLDGIDFACFGRDSPEDWIGEWKAANAPAGTASNFAIGQVLCQGEGKEERVIAYESRKLNPAELKYPTHDKELLSLVYGLPSRI